LVGADEKIMSSERRFFSIEELFLFSKLKPLSWLLFPKLNPKIPNGSSLLDSYLETSSLIFSSSTSSSSKETTFFSFGTYFTGSFDFYLF
jgi:hypothetical protein